MMKIGATGYDVLSDSRSFFGMNVTDDVNTTWSFQESGAVLNDG